MSQQRQPKSPYQRYDKSPFVYSPTYQFWRKAILSNDKAEADKQTCHHMRQFGNVKSEAYQKACPQQQGESK